MCKILCASCDVSQHPNGLLGWGGCLPTCGILCWACLSDMACSVVHGDVCGHRLLHISCRTLVRHPNGLVCQFGLLGRDSYTTIPKGVLSVTNRSKRPSGPGMVLPIAGCP